MSHTFEVSPAVEETLPNRPEVLNRMYRGLYASMNFSVAAPEVGINSTTTRVAHPLLSRMLFADPSVSAILPSAQSPIALGLSEHAPFFVARSGLLLLPPVLLGNTWALAAATRWGGSKLPIFLVHAR